MVERKIRWGVLSTANIGRGAVIPAIQRSSNGTLLAVASRDLTKGRDAEVFDRSIDNQVSRLRRKIEVDPKNPRYIKTVWGGGYMFTSDVEIL